MKRLAKWGMVTRLAQWGMGASLVLIGGVLSIAYPGVIVLGLRSVDWIAGAIFGVGVVVMLMAVYGDTER